MVWFGSLVFFFVFVVWICSFGVVGEVVLALLVLLFIWFYFLFNSKESRGGKFDQLGCCLKMGGDLSFGVLLFQWLLFFSEKSFSQKR